MLKTKTLPIFFVALCTFSAPALGTELKSRTVAAFDQYVQLREGQMAAAGEHGSFLRVDRLAPQQREQAYARLRSGDVLIERQQAPEISDGLIHHWVATAFIPGTTLAQAVALLKDYGNYQNVYRPEVERSRVLEHKGEEYRAALRLRQQHALTVVLDTEYDVRFVAAGTHASVRSHSTRIAEVEAAGEKAEHELPPGNDHGFLWRINTYWQLVEKDGGVYAQCEAISLTRDVPTGLGWLVGSYIESIPRESLLFTLNATRKALEHKQ